MPRWSWPVLVAIALALLFAENSYEKIHGRGSTWWMWALAWLLLTCWMGMRRWRRRRAARRAGDLLLEAELPPAPRRGKFSGEVLLDREVKTDRSPP